MFQTCFECGRRGQVLQSHPLPISPLLQTPDRLFHLHDVLCWEPPGLAQSARGPFGPGTPKESEKSPKGCPERGAPESPKSAPRSPKRVQKKKPEAAFLDSFRTPGRTLWGLWGCQRPEASGHPFGLFSDSFGVPGPGSTLCQAGGFPKSCENFARYRGHLGPTKDKSNRKAAELR